MYLQPGRVVSFEVFRRKREKRECSARVLPYLAPTKPGPRLPERPNGVPPSSPFRGVELTRREVEHRHRMLQHLSDGGADCAV
jgi:hypothetical protein